MSIESEREWWHELYAKNLSHTTIDVLLNSIYSRDQGCRLFWKVGGNKSSAESLKILAEIATYDFSAQNWTKNAKFIDFLRDSVHGKCFYSNLCQKNGE
jgi:hypothetical protein